MAGRHVYPNNCKRCRDLHAKLHCFYVTTKVPRDEEEEEEEELRQAS